jgi:hypothetical protein
MRLSSMPSSLSLHCGPWRDEVFDCDTATMRLLRCSFARRLRLVACCYAETNRHFIWPTEIFVTSGSDGARQWQDLALLVDVHTSSAVLRTETRRLQDDHGKNPAQSKGGATRPAV